MSDNMETKNSDSKDIKKAVKCILYIFRVAISKKPTIFIVYIILFVAQIMQKIQIVILPKFLIDELVSGLNGAELSKCLFRITLIIGMICLLSLLASMIISITIQCKSIFEEWFNEYFEALLAEHALSMDFELTENPAVLNQLNRAKEGIGWYSGGVIGILNCVFDIINHLVILFGVGTIVVFVSPVLLPIQIAGLLMISFFNARNNAIEVDNHTKMSKLNRVFRYFLYQLSDFTYGKEIRLYDSSEMMLTRTQLEIDKMTAIWKETAKRQRHNFWGMDFFNALRDGLNYLCISLLLITKKITIGDFSMCISATSELYQGLQGLVNCSQEVVKRCRYLNFFLEFLEYPKTLDLGKEKIGEINTIEFRHVSFKYPRAEEYVLKDINIKISAGEHLSIVGLNGAGKTTFIKLLCRLYDVSEGEILINGINIKNYSQKEYTKLFSVVFQDFCIFAFSVKENIVFENRVVDDEINQVLQMSDVYEDIMELPKGLDTFLNKQYDGEGTELSGGQQQKIAIARALYKNAPVYILDEPTASLDPIAEQDIYKLFNNLIGKKTALFISHRLSSCRFCDHIAVFSDKTIKEYGTHEDLCIKQNGIYAEMFETQSSLYG